MIQYGLCGRDVIAVLLSALRWGGEIQACFMDCETNPFTGKPFFNEVNLLPMLYRERHIVACRTRNNLGSETRIKEHYVCCECSHTGQHMGNFGLLCSR